MNHHNLFSTALILLTISVSMGSSAEESCEILNSDNLDELVADISDIYPSSYAGSCVVRAAVSKESTWRNHFDTRIEAFVKTTTTQYESFESLENLAIYETESSKELKEKLEASRAVVKEWEGHMNRNKDIRMDFDTKKENDDNYRAAQDKYREDAKKLKKFQSDVIASRMKKSILDKMSTGTFKQKLKTLANNKKCINEPRIIFAPETGIVDRSTQDEIKEVINERENQNLGRSIVSCTNVEKFHSKLEPVLERESVDISKSDFFANNQSELSESKINNIISSIKKKLTSNKPNCEKKIKSVQIETSASQLANSDEVGRWDFLKLSKTRAEFLSVAVASKLKLDREVKIDINPRGKNGNGTSGPCPYKLLKTKKNTFEVERDSNVSEQELEKARFGNISFEIDEVGPGCDNSQKTTVNPSKDYYATKCFTTYLTCSDDLQK